MSPESGGVLTPAATHKCFVTLASRERKDGRKGEEERTPGGREGGRVKRSEPQPAPGKATIKAVMLGWGSLLGGPCARNYSSTSPFPFSVNFHFVAIF